ncbi:MAG: hypothetical protein C4523_09575 [Myxococcales bacterium]|nr:MAG: hypothetical protein C4523_09575 [Myxococcales bacterium]
MPKIRVAQTHALAREELVKRVGSFLDRLRDEKLKAADFEYKWNDAQTAAAITGKGFSGDVKVGDGEVAVALDLSLMLTPIKGKVEESLKRGLEKVLA